MNRKLRAFLFTLLAIFIAGFVFVTFFLKDIVNNRLQKEIKSTFGEFYQLSFDRSATALSTSGFSISFQKVEFKTDTSNAYMLTKYPAIFFETDLLKINNIHVLNLLLDSKLAVGSVAIDEPQLLFFIPKNGEALDDSGSQSNSNDFIEHIDINDISIKDGKASFVFQKHRSDTLFSGKNFFLNIENLGLDLKSKENIVRTGTLNQMEFSLESLKMAPLNSDYTYAIDVIAFNYQEEIFQAKKLAIKPTGNPKQMAATSQFRKSIFSIQVDSLAYLSKDFNALKNREYVNGELLNIMGLNMVIDRNKSIPLDETKHKKLFHQSLMELPIDINLDSILIKNTSIDYRVHSKGNNKPGRLLLTKIDGSIANINTEAQSDVEAKFEGTFMADGPFNLNIQLPLSKPKTHSYNGNIGAMDFTSLNPLVANLTKVKMEEGKIERIDFDGVGSELVNEGNMTLAFSDLKLSVTGSDNSKKWLQSGLGNLLVRNNNRTDGASATDSIKYTYQRPPYKDHLDLYGTGLINGFAKGVLPKAIYSMVMQD